MSIRWGSRQFNNNALLRELQALITAHPNAAVWYQPMVENLIKIPEVLALADPHAYMVKHLLDEAMVPSDDSENLFDWIAKFPSYSFTLSKRAAMAFELPSLREKAVAALSEPEYTSMGEWLPADIYETQKHILSSIKWTK